MQFLSVIMRENDSIALLCTVHRFSETVGYTQDDYFYAEVWEEPRGIQ